MRSEPQRSVVTFVVVVDHDTASIVNAVLDIDYNFRCFSEELVPNAQRAQNGAKRRDKIRNLFRGATCLINRVKRVEFLGPPDPSCPSEK